MAPNNRWRGRDALVLGRGGNLVEIAGPVRFRHMVGRRLTFTVTRHMGWLSPCQLRAVVALSALAAGVCPVAVAQNSNEKPTVTEVQAIEAKVRMPQGAAALGTYVRYYYASDQSGGRVISGIYVDEKWFRSSEIPATRIVLVNSAANVPAVEDAGCGVVYIEYDSARSAIVSASCSAELIPK